MNLGYAIYVWEYGKNMKKPREDLEEILSNLNILLFNCLCSRTGQHIERFNRRDYLSPGRGYKDFTKWIRKYNRYFWNQNRLL